MNLGEVPTLGNIMKTEIKETVIHLNSTKWTRCRYFILSRAVISAFLLTFNALSCIQRFYS